MSMFKDGFRWKYWSLVFMIGYRLVLMIWYPFHGRIPFLASTKIKYHTGWSLGCSDELGSSAQSASNSFRNLHNTRSVKCILKPDRHCNDAFGHVLAKFSPIIAFTLSLPLPYLFFLTISFLSFYLYLLDAFAQLALEGPGGWGVRSSAAATPLAAIQSLAALLGPAAASASRARTATNIWTPALRRVPFNRVRVTAR